MTSRRLISTLAALTLCACSSPPKATPLVRDASQAVVKTIQGRLVWPDSSRAEEPGYLGRPMAGFRVSAYRLGEQLQLYTGGLTDAEGRFELSGLEVNAGERLSLVVTRSERRYAVAKVRRSRVSWRSGSRASAREWRWVNVVDLTETPSGRYEAQTWQVEPRLVKTSLRRIWNPEKKAAEVVEGEPVGVLRDGTWSGVELAILPLVPKSDVHWSDGDKIATGVQEELDVLVDDLPEELADPAARLALCQDTWLLHPAIKTWEQGAIARTGLRGEDLLRLSERAPVALDAEGAAPRLDGERWPLNYEPEPPLSEADLEALEGRRIVLSPGHGLFLAPEAREGASAKEWVSPRRFMSQAENPALTIPGIIEDDLTAQISRRLLEMLEAAGAEVVALRELRDWTREGAAHPSSFTFAPWAAKADPNLPRLWEQNTKYLAGLDKPELLGERGEVRVVGARGAVPSWHRADGNLDDNGRGLRARVEWLRAEAAAAPIDAFIAIHTNAAGNGPKQTAKRGSLGLVLDVLGDDGASANSASEALAERLLRGLSAETQLPTRGAVSMRALGKGVAVLRDTYPHAYRIPEVNGQNKTARFERRASAPAGEAAPELIAGELTDADQGWRFNPFPQAIPATLIEVAYHDHPEDAALLQFGWFQRKAALGLLRGLAEDLAARADADPPPGD